MKSKTHMKLGDICSFQSGGTPSKSHEEYFNGSIPWISTVALNGGTIDQNSAIAWITEKAIEETAAKIVPPGSVMVGTRVGIGKVAVNSVPMSTSQDIISLVGIDNKNWNTAYLCRFIQAKAPFLKSQARGATIKGIKIDVLENLELLELPLERQRKIAQSLEIIEKIIATRRAQLAALDELVKARFVEMFGDPVGNPMGWPVHQLSEFIAFLTSGSRGWAKYCNENGKEWFITIKNVKNCRISTSDMQPINPPDNAEAKRTKVQEGDLLISITADLGRTGVVSKEIAEHGAYINQHLTCIRLKQSVLEPLYVAYFMESPAGKEQFDAKNQSAVKAGLNFNAINSLKVLVPPQKLQTAFVAFVARVERLKAAIQRSLEEAQRLFDSQLQEHFG